MQVFNSIKIIFNELIEVFNERFGTSYSSDNIILQGLNEKNKIEVFEKFCIKYFPYRLEDNYKDEDYFEFYASAFVGKDNIGVDGILYREDKIESLNTIYHILYHELAHIYLVHNEFQGKSFYDVYCNGFFEDKVEDGIVNAGYAVWRETVAEILAQEMGGPYFVKKLVEKKKELERCIRQLCAEDWKFYLSRILTEVMMCAEIDKDKSWGEIETLLKRYKMFDNVYLLKIINLLHNQFTTNIFNIDLDFIMMLGDIAIWIHQDACLKQFGNNILGDR